MGRKLFDRIDAFAFADGSTYSWSDIIQMMDAQATGSPAIYGFDDFNDVLDPGPGVHYLSGGNGDKTYIFDFGDTFDTVQDNVTNILGGQFRQCHPVRPTSPSRTSPYRWRAIPGTSSSPCRTVRPW